MYFTIDNQLLWYLGWDLTAEINQPEQLPKILQEI